MKERFLRRVRNTLLTGLLLLIPVAGSMFLFWKIFLLIDRALPAVMGARWFPGVGFFVTVGLIFCAGLLAKNWFGRKIIALGNSIIVSIPLLNKVYLILKQITDSINVDKKAMFSRTVLIEFPRKDSYAIGFVTCENNSEFSEKAGKKLVAVFVPKVPNPAAGFLLFVPEEEVKTLDISVETGFKLIVSAGIICAEKPAAAQPFGDVPQQGKWTGIFKRKPHTAKPADPDPLD